MLPTLNQITDMWEKDAVIKTHQYSSAAMETAVLHAKYLKMLTQYENTLRQLTRQKERLKLSLYDYYDRKAEPEMYERKGIVDRKVLVKDMPDWIQADNDMQQLNDSLDVARIAVATLKEILQVVKFRNNAIKSAIEWEKFAAGE